MLYKYSNWSDDKTKQNIKEHHLYFNTAQKFNDPFDTFACFSIGDKDYLEGLFRAEGVEKDKQIGLTDEQLLNLARLMDRAEPQNSRCGITCFSTSCDSILMWAMYGDKNRGICLGFDINSTDVNGVKGMLSCDDNISCLLDARFEMLDIVYQKDRPVLSYEKNYDIRALLHTKFQEWSYENEVRLMIRTESQYLFPSVLSYSPKYLNEIILGAMMPIGDFLGFYDGIVKSNININYKLTVLDKSLYKYNIICFSTDKMSQLRMNVKYLERNANKIISCNRLLKDTLLGVSRKKCRDYFKETIYALPIYYFYDFFPVFLKKQYDADFLMNSRRMKDFKYVYFTII